MVKLFIRLASLGSLISAMTAVGGCASAKPVALDVHIRDAVTHDPISGALVVGDTPSQDHPFSVASLLGETGPLASRADSDLAGKARIEGLMDRPLRITIIVQQRAPRFILLDPHPGTTGKTLDWASLTRDSAPGGDEASSGNLEVRVEPAR